MLYELVYLLTMLRGNADDSTALTKACSVSVRWQVGRTVIVNERGKKRNILFLSYNTSKRDEINNKIEGCNSFI